MVIGAVTVSRWPESVRHLDMPPTQSSLIHAQDLCRELLGHAFEINPFVTHVNAPLEGGH